MTKTGHEASRNLDLEAVIVDDPDDVAGWQVYFDWLQSEGDPWGERGNLVLARDKARGPARAKLIEQIEEFDEQHAEALYGKSLLGLIERSDFTQVAQLSDRHGFIWSATVKSPEFEWPGTAPNAILGALVDSPAARFLTEIDIGLMDWDPASLQGAIDAITQAGELDNLRSLFIGDFEYPHEQEISWVEVGTAGKVLPVAPNLRSLHVRGGGIELGELEHDTLERLVIETGGLPRSAVASVGKCKLPALISMEVWFGRNDYGGDGNVAQLAELLRGQGVPRLKHLALANCEWQDDIAVALTRSELLAQLETVDLSMGTMHGAGVEAIITNADKYKHLKRLDVGENFLTGDQVERLTAALGEIVQIGSQRAPQNWGGELYYYTSVGE